MTEVVHYDGHHHYTLHVFMDGVQGDHAYIEHYGHLYGEPTTVEEFSDVQEAKVAFNKLTGEGVY